MLVDEMMHGFTPRNDGLVAFQHGSFCGNHPGASLCVRNYGWDQAKGAMQLIGQSVYDDANPASSRSCSMTGAESGPNDREEQSD